MTDRDIPSLPDDIAKMVQRLQELEYFNTALRAMMDHAYEGIIVVDRQGIVQEFNAAYARFLGVPPAAVIGRHVTEVIENTRMHVVLETGIPERREIQYIQGKEMVCNRIPIWRDGRVVGAVGSVVFQSVSELQDILEKVHALERKHHWRVKHSAPSRAGYTFDHIIGTSPAIRKVKEMAHRAARSRSSVLLLGESGTGKELFAEAIHYASPFAHGPFVGVNCAAIPDALLESELFGYEEGAFTGARKGGKPGKFELAQGGTLFLDEVADLPISAQAKLLRVLQEKEVERLGGTSTRPVDIRMVAATNAPLLQWVREGRFRKDLYYRLNVIALDIPPLRARREDIPELAEYHLARLCATYGIPRKTIAPKAMRYLMEYDWPGNVRELVNLLERCVALVSEDVLDVGVLRDVGFLQDIYSSNANAFQSGWAQAQEQKERGSPEGNVQTGWRGSVAEAEREMLKQILIQTAGNRTEAARRLGIHRSTLYKKIKRYGLDQA